MLAARRRRVAFGVALAIVAGAAATALAFGVGQKVKSVQVKDANDKPAWIPDIGKKVITLFYTDPDVKDQNERFRELLKAEKFDLSKYRGLGVVNMKDTWKPNFAIRRVVRDKIAKFKSLILTDPDHTLKNAWQLGDCNEKDVVIILDKTGKVRYFKPGPMSADEMKRTVQLVKDLVTKG